MLMILFCCCFGEAGCGRIRSETNEHELDQGVGISKDKSMISERGDDMRFVPVISRFKFDPYNKRELARWPGSSAWYNNELPDGPWVSTRQAFQNDEYGLKDGRRSIALITEI